MIRTIELAHRFLGLSAIDIYKMTQDEVRIVDAYCYLRLLKEESNRKKMIDDPDSEIYHDNMPGMTLDEFNEYADRLIREVKTNE